MKIFLLFALVGLSVPVHAAPYMNCQINRVPRMEKAEYPSESRDEEIARKMVESDILNRKFTLDMETGLFKGDISNASQFGVPEVLDSGMNSGTYKSLMSYEYRNTTGKKVLFLVIEIGDKVEKKRFTFIDGIDVYLGHCKMVEN
jgi:hypothetical protein